MRRFDPYRRSQFSKEGKMLDTSGWFWYFYYKKLAEREAEEKRKEELRKLTGDRR